MMRWPRTIARTAVLALALAAAGLPGGSDAAAEELQLSRYGARFGLSSDPDQLTLGAYAGFGELAPDLQLRPSLDVGFGDDILSVIANADLQYFFSIRDARLSPYFGGGLGIAYYDFDLPEGARNFDDSTTEIGVNLYVGAEKQLGNYKTAHLELRVGIDEMPDLKVTFGLGFY
jgi:hypothetical protein